MPTAREVVAATVVRLREAGVPTQTRVTVARGRFGRTKFRAAGDVWRLGALCLGPDGAVFATGTVLIVAEPTHPNHRSAAALERNEMRAQLRKAGIPAGTTVVLDAAPLDVDAPEPPLVATPHGLGVQWIAGGAAIPFEAYVTERTELLLHPPEGSTDA